jgi:hypothetical protein
LPAGVAQYDLMPLAPALFAPPQSPPGELASYLDRERPDWVVLEISKRILTVPRTKPVYASIRERGELIATFAGEAEPRAFESLLDYQNAREFARRVLTADALGPRIEVYRMR